MPNNINNFKDVISKTEKITKAINTSPMANNILKISFICFPQ